MFYSYEAKDNLGQLVTGSLEALDVQTAARQVRDMGHFPIRVVPTIGSAPKVQPKAARPQGFAAWLGVDLGTLAVCYRQWSTLLHAGVPLMRSLKLLADQTTSKTLRRSLNEIARTITQGGTISEGMAQFPGIYTDFHRAMIRSGEEAGALDLVFRRLADALEQEMAMRRTLKRETLLPKIQFALSFLLPPLFYLFIGGVGAYVQHAVVPLLEVCGIGAGVFALARLGARHRVGYDAVTANFPGIGRTVRLIALARFARTLASLYGAGVGMVKAVQVAADACGNTFLGNKMLRAVEELSIGRGLAASLARTGAFPPMVVSMMETGEQTGSLDAMMEKVAEHYEQDAAVRLHQTAIAVGTAATLFVAVKVGIIVIQFYKGYFSALLGSI